MSPYIKQERRIGLEELLETAIERVEIKGELTYCAYKLALDYIKQKGKNYQNISDAVAALNDAAHEIRRRVMDDYEDKKCIQNGDI